MKSKFMKVRTLFFVMARRWSKFTAGQKKTVCLGMAVIGPLVIVAVHAGMRLCGAEPWFSASTTWVVQSIISVVVLTAINIASKDKSISRSSKNALRL